MTKRRMDIEAVLRWAYRDELPKMAARGTIVMALGYGQAWGGMERYGDLLTVIDAPVNEFGVVPDFRAAAGPHPDAERVHAAVVALDNMELGLPDGWDPFADLPSLGADGVAAATRAVRRLACPDRSGKLSLRALPGHLLRLHAILGGAPDWQAEEPVRKVVCGANGKPAWFRRILVTTDGVDGPLTREVEVDGIQPSRRMPYPDAYQRHRYEPDPELYALARAEYEIWHAALSVVAADLDGLLDTIEVCESPRHARPWEDGEAAAPRILDDLRKVPVPMAIKPKRRRARAPA